MLLCGTGVGAITSSYALRILCVLVVAVIGCVCNGDGVVKGTEYSGSPFVLHGLLLSLSLLVLLLVVEIILLRLLLLMVRLVLLAAAVVVAVATVVVETLVASTNGEARNFWWLLGYRIQVDLRALVQILFSWRDHHYIHLTCHFQSLIMILIRMSCRCR